MFDASSSRDGTGRAARARLMLVGATCALVLLGVLAPLAAGGPAPDSGRARDDAAHVVRHEATVSTNAAGPARSHRLAAPGAFLVFTCLAAAAARHMASRGRRSARRRVEQFHVLLRGPPAHLVVAH